MAFEICMYRILCRAVILGDLKVKDNSTGSDGTDGKGDWDYQPRVNVLYYYPRSSPIDFQEPPLTSTMASTEPIESTGLMPSDQNGKNTTPASSRTRTEKINWIDLVGFYGSFMQYFNALFSLIKGGLSRNTSQSRKT